MTEPADLSPAGQRIVESDDEALQAGWAFGMDITGLRPGAWDAYMQARFDAVLAGLAEGSGEEPGGDEPG